MQVFIDADHNGFDRKQKIVAYLRRHKIDVVDLGADINDPNDDFPHAAARVAQAVLSSNKKAHGILICGSGQGVCMAANRYKGIRAALCWDNYSAQAARNDDDANVLCLPGRIMSDSKAIAILHTWLNTPFAGATRFKRRIRQMDEQL